MERSGGVDSSESRSRVLKNDNRCGIEPANEGVEMQHALTCSTGGARPDAGSECDNYYAAREGGYLQQLTERILQFPVLPTSRSNRFVSAH